MHMHCTALTVRPSVRKYARPASWPGVHGTEVTDSSMPHPASRTVCVEYPSIIPLSQYRYLLPIPCNIERNLRIFSRKNSLSLRIKNLSLRPLPGADRSLMKQKLCVAV